MTSTEIINHLQLISHPEGGYYKETYRGADKHTNVEGNERNISTAIYFLLENDDKSHLHRIKSDELWFFHQGEPLEIISLQNGELVSIILGNDFGKGEAPQAMIPGNTWFGSRVKDGKGYSLVSCTVAPGFDFKDFEMAVKEDLMEEYPVLKEIVEEMAIQKR